MWSQGGKALKYNVTPQLFQTERLISSRNDNKKSRDFTPGVLGRGRFCPLLMTNSSGTKRCQNVKTLPLYSHSNHSSTKNQQLIHAPTHIDRSPMWRMAKIQGLLCSKSSSAALRLSNPTCQAEAGTTLYDEHNIESLQPNLNMNYPIYYPWFLKHRSDVKVYILTTQTPGTRPQTLDTIKRTTKYQHESL